MNARERLATYGDRSLPRRGGSSGGGKGDHSDPTLARVLDVSDQAVASHALANLRELDDLIAGAALKLERAVAIVDSVTITAYHRPNNNPGCQNCARVVGTDGKAHPEAWQEVAARGVCAWCYRFQYGDGPDRPGYAVAPVYELVRWHLDHLGSVAPRTMIRDLMPDEYRAREAVKRQLSRGEAPACTSTCTYKGTDYRCDLGYAHGGEEHVHERPDGSELRWSIAGAVANFREVGAA